MRKSSKPPHDSQSKPGAFDLSLPYSIFPGKLKLGNMEVECHVLNDLRRVLTQREVVRILSAGRESGQLAPCVNSNPL